MGGDRRIRLRVHIVHQDEVHLYIHLETDTDPKTWVAVQHTEATIVQQIEGTLHEIEILEWVAERKNLT